MNIYFKQFEWPYVGPNKAKQTDKHQNSTCRYTLLILFSNTNYKGKQGRYKAPDCWFSQFVVNLTLHLMHLTSFWKYPLVSFISCQARRVRRALNFLNVYFTNDKFKKKIKPYKYTFITLLQWHWIKIIISPYWVTNRSPLSCRPNLYAIKFQRRCIFMIVEEGEPQRKS